MAIAKKPKRNHSEMKHETTDNAAEKFISGADAARNETPEEGGKKIPIMIRCDPALLHRIDAAAKHRGISRSSWIQFTLSRALDQGEG
jgi:predicted HicB family RNase H-like nuclease